MRATNRQITTNKQDKVPTNSEFITVRANEEIRSGNKIYSKGATFTISKSEFKQLTMNNKDRLCIVDY